MKYLNIALIDIEIIIPNLRINFPIPGHPAPGRADRKQNIRNLSPNHRGEVLCVILKETLAIPAIFEYNKLNYYLLT